jgi:methylated-DNA-[protein]-cysteine S-methyltransferase
MSFVSKIVSSPIGELKLIASEKGLCAVLFHEGKDSVWKEASTQIERHVILDKAEKQLAEYFAGSRYDFDLPLDVRGTDFRKSAWKQLCKIPYGETISYGEQAKRMGDAKKSRATGQANGHNPRAIVIPCHRVVGANGSLTGFGGGLNIKKYLLEMEAKCAADASKKVA